MIMDKVEGKNDVQVAAEDSLEFRLLMAYTRKRRPTDSRLHKNRTDENKSTTEDHVDRRKKNKKSLSKRLNFFVKCIKPQTKDDCDQQRQPAILNGDSDADKVEDMANILTEISNSVHLEPCYIEPDGEDDNSQESIIQKIAELLKEEGDELNEKILADKNLRESLLSSLTYGFFSNLMDTFCTSATQELQPVEEPEKTEVALICEATSKLFGVDHHPMNRVLGYGATYLQDKFPMWISINVGNVENGEEEEEEEEKEGEEEV